MGDPGRIIATAKFGEAAGLGVCGGLLFSDTASLGDAFGIGIIDFVTTSDASSCDVDDVDEVLLRTLWIIPESGEALRLGCGPTSSMERRVLSISSVEANATNRSKPELTRSCQCVSSSAPSSVARG